jgi:alcohol dehydrogenase (cytochrome c)/quinohemoprotein ethanol dehydrogenase
MVGWGGIYPLITGPLSQASGQVINRSRLLTFKLKGEAVLPSSQMLLSQLPDTGQKPLPEKALNKGFAVYDRFCGACHGAGAVGGGVIPDLRFSAVLNNAALWAQIVREGALASRGMAAFGEEVSAADAEAIRAYVIGRNRFARSQQELTRKGR